MGDRTLSRARRDELILDLAARLRAWSLREPAIVLLSWHAPLAFLGSQLLLAAQPFLGVLQGDSLAGDLALLLQEPESVERLIAQLERA